MTKINDMNNTKINKRIIIQCKMGKHKNNSCTRILCRHIDMHQMDSTRKYSWINKVIKTLRCNRSIIANKGFTWDKCPLQTSTDKKRIKNSTAQQTTSINHLKKHHNNSLYSPEVFFSTLLKHPNEEAINYDYQKDSLHKFNCYCQNTNQPVGSHRVTIRLC